MKLNIGERIRKYRRELDLTQDELAQAIGISNQSISKWERGDGYPDRTAPEYSKLLWNHSGRASRQRQDRRHGSGRIQGEV